MPPSAWLRSRGLATSVALFALVAVAGCGGNPAAVRSSDRATVRSSPATVARVVPASTTPAPPTTALPTTASPTTAPPTTAPPTTAPHTTAPPTTAPPTTAARPVSTPRSGTGSFATANLSYPATTRGRLVRYAVQVEGGVPVSTIDFAQQVHATLTDPRGWQGVDGVAFAEVADPASAEFIVTLATPDTTDRLCAPLDTDNRLDCFNGHRAVINSDRWLLGAASWGSDRTGYRHQVVNHEVGHAIGHNHRYCPAAGAPAPVMQQQTISLQGCAPNAWPAVTHG